MCGIAAVFDLARRPVRGLAGRLRLMNRLQAHRGPDGEGVWLDAGRAVGLGHRRLSIIDIEAGQQPMLEPSTGAVITYNGEVYNYIELREELGGGTRTRSDTEVILRAHARWGRECPLHLRGMFSFALWDPREGALLCARDRFGIKPLYYAVADGVLHVASEVKALLPWLGAVETDREALKEYLTFQFCLEGRTLFSGVRELPPAHTLWVKDGRIEERRYWEVQYDLDFDHTARYFRGQVEAHLEDSVRLHLRSDVPVGAYLSGGLDSSGVAAMAAEVAGGGIECFHGRFADGPEYDESEHARRAAAKFGAPLHVADMGPSDFTDSIRKLIWHLDFPVAGPGAFPQFIVSRLAATRRKVVLSGLGGDEVFGGYTRYLIAYFEQCIKAAIDGTMGAGNFIVTYQSILPNLSALRQYKPLLQMFWKEGLFEDPDRRYFRLVNRAHDLREEVRWELLEPHSPYDAFRRVFFGPNVRKESYFDSMTHFDFKTLLPALLHVEDRMSMAHGLESRVPILDHPLIELTATVPSDVKFKDGAMKQLLRHAMRDRLPPSVLGREDKMGFPVPLSEWLQGPLRTWAHDVLSTGAARGRELIDNAQVVRKLSAEPRYGRRTWGLLCLELWQQEFHDRQQELRNMKEEALACES